VALVGRTGPAAFGLGGVLVVVKAFSSRHGNPFVGSRLPVEALVKPMIVDSRQVL
jgi:hypothetical protein